MQKLFDFIFLTCYCGLIYWLSAQHTLPTPQIFTFQDKVLHAGAYFLMSLLAWRCVRHLVKQVNLQMLATVIFCSFYGVTDEWHQSFVAGRSSDVFDWLADTVGAGFAMWGFYQVKLKNIAYYVK